MSSRWFLTLYVNVENQSSYVDDILYTINIVHTQLKDKLLKIKMLANDLYVVVHIGRKQSPQKWLKNRIQKTACIPLPVNGP